jgi:uncharacterized protein
MKTNLLAFLILALPVLCVRSLETVSFPQRVILGNTELRSIHSEVTGREYLLFIGYPDAYGSHPERKYPVVYVTDGYWNFVKTCSMGSSLWYDQIVPEYIVVGIGYAGDNVDYGRERCYELSPTVQTYGKDAANHYRMGGSRAFLTAIKGEIIPFVERTTQADPSFRVLAGSSLGGLFSLYAMYEEPGLFQGVIAASPAVPWDNFWIFRRASELRNKAIGDDGRGTYCVPTRLFMSVGDAEWPDFVGSIKAFDQIVKSSDYADFSYEFRIIEGERHGGSCLEAFQRGIRFVFKPMMPSAVIPD